MSAKNHFSLSRVVLAVLVVSLGWGFRSGRLLWTGSGFELASFKVPAEAPTAAVHPEVLNLQASFNQVAELVKPAVVSVTTVKVERGREVPQFFFGDPFEQFFEQFGGPRGSPYGRPRPAPRPAPQFKMEG